MIKLCNKKIIYTMMCGIFFAMLIMPNLSFGQEDVNESLKNIIEENEELIAEKEKMEDEIEKLRNEKLLSQKNYENLLKDRDVLAATVQQIKSENRKYSKEISELQESIKELQIANEDFSKKTKRLEEELAIQDEWKKEELSLSLSLSEKNVVEEERKTLDLLSKIDAFTENDEKLRADAAKAHYNMGNIYFQKGQYEIAFREYYQAVTLMPNDADSHHNLAFVSGEFLNDQKTALKHYKMYLYLKPDAKDAHVIKEKIIKATLSLRGVVDSPLEKKFK